MRSLFRLITIATLVLGLNGMAQASPLFSIGEGGDRTWGQAIADGNVRVVDPLQGGELTQAEVDFFTNQVGLGNFALVEPTVTADLNVEVLGETHQSLLIQWNPAPGFTDEDQLSVVAWEYVYDQDPDLTGVVIHFSFKKT